MSLLSTWDFALGNLTSPIEHILNCFVYLGFFALGNLTSPIERTLRFSDVLLVYALLSQLLSSLVTLDIQHDYHIHLML